MGLGHKLSYKDADTFENFGTYNFKLYNFKIHYNNFQLLDTNLSWLTGRSATRGVLPAAWCLLPIYIWDLAENNQRGGTEDVSLHNDISLHSLYQITGWRQLLNLRRRHHSITSQQPEVQSEETAHQSHFFIHFLLRKQV